MSEQLVYGPDGPDAGAIEGVFEFDCLELVSPELRAKARPGKWVSMTRPPDGLDPAAGPSPMPAPDAPPPAGG